MEVLYKGEDDTHTSKPGKRWASARTHTHTHTHQQQWYLSDALLAVFMMRDHRNKSQ